jgi:uncharacterized protein
MNLVNGRAIEALFAEGVEHFNRGRFFEAHEKWEEIWKTATGPEKLFYQGLIQAAAALHHAQRGNLRGAASVYFKAKPKLEQIPEIWKDLQIANLRSGLAAYLEGLEEVAADPYRAIPTLKRASAAREEIGIPWRGSHARE